MDYFISFMEHPFIKAVIADGNEVFKYRNIDITKLDFEPEPQFDEYEFFIHNVGFWLVSFIQHFDQLKFAIEFMSNYDYSKNYESNRPDRVDHLLYTVENFHIRYSSIFDRIMQLLNSVFHLGLDESKVDYSVIITNIKIKRTIIPKAIKNIRKIVYENSEIRNQIIHRHSYRDVKLWKLRLFYSNKDLDNNNESDKALIVFRTERLKGYIKSKKEEFVNLNTAIQIEIDKLFDILLIEYCKQKNRLSILR